jgi:hypothetical protein
MHAAMQIAVVFVPAMVMTLLRGPLGVLYLICAAVMKVRRRRQLRRFRRAVLRHQATRRDHLSSDDVLRLTALLGNESPITG